MEIFVGVKYEKINGIPNPNWVYGSYKCYTYGVADCPNLKHVNIPSNIDSIGDYAFARCQHLIDTIIDIKISHLGEGIFCDSLDVTMEFF